MRPLLLLVAVLGVAYFLSRRGSTGSSTPAEPEPAARSHEPGDPAPREPAAQRYERARPAVGSAAVDAAPSRVASASAEVNGGAPALPADFNSRLPTREVPIPGFQPLPGAEDPGPGPYMALYHGLSGQLSPSARPDGTQVTTRNESMGPPPVLTAWVPSVRVQAGQPVTIYATLRLPTGAVVPPDHIAIAVVRSGEAPPGESTPMRPAPAGADHDFEYSFQTPAQSATTGPREYRYAVEARGAIQGTSFERAAAGGFTVHTPGGHADAASASVSRAEGNLALTLRVTIERAGTYWAYAELWGGENGTRSVAFARDRWENQAPGEHSYTLTFGGLIIRDSGIDGPYVVRNVRLMQVDSIPPQEEDPILQLPPTPAWRASEFF